MALLEVAGIRTRYGAIEALKGVSLSVDAGDLEQCHQASCPR